MKRKSILVAPVLAILLNTSLNAEQFSISNLSLKQAIEEISKKSNMPYMVDGKLLDGKKAPNIKNIEGVENALNEILKDTNLKATIEDGTILIREKAIGQGTVLEPISVNTGKSGTAEAGYLTENITGVGLWGKRSLQDTPYSMNVISQELIENTQANTMAQIFKMNPLTQDGGDRPTGNYVTVIRGFNSNNAVINGMPLADFYSFTTMEDLESVETISGATGFLYGGGRVGGAVNYVIKKPTLEDKRSIKIGNYGGEQYYTHIDLSGQIDEKKVFGYRINALYQDGDSVNDIGKEQKFASITFDFKPTDNFTMDLNYAHRDLKRTKQKLSISLSDSDSVRPILDVSKNYSPDWNKTTETNDRVMPSIKWDINDIFTLRSSLLYEKSDSKTTGDTLAYIRPDGLYDIENTKYSNQPDEFENYVGNVYLDSKFETLGVNHLLTLGYSENYYKYSIARNWFEYEDFYGIALNEIKNLPIPSATVQNSEIIPSTKTQYKNILIGDDIVFNDQWSTLVGFNYATVVQTSYDDGVKSSKYDKSELTPTLSLMYKPFEDLTTYVTYIESLEQGTIVGTQYSNANQVLDPLVSKQYEVGAKYSLLDEKLLLTSALFRIEKANQYSDNATPKPKYVQDGEQIHQGMELTATGKVTDNLTIFGGGTLIDIEVEKSNDKALEGKKPINAASKMAKLYAEYNIPHSGLTVTGGAYYTGKKYVDRLNTDILPSYTLYDAGLRYKTKLDKYPTTFLLNVSNLTGEDYWASNFYLGDPRSVAISMKMEF
ncbi:TonB-dependent siderophore receptor [Aliarcobacter butzleri]|uniref:TonB-dependent siderophore receptor n=1 Tax=Aliarcobacter butzleri TaxID=28197 RepID=UPI001EDF9340|nr:TonB-dependent siderophore receptor [Aliarcobacter butzleri]MCG3681993.1 TonB-dependent siderophore receptor [Aliarcobacter butzleri]